MPRARSQKSDPTPSLAYRAGYTTGYMAVGCLLALPFAVLIAVAVALTGHHIAFTVAYALVAVPALAATLIRARSRWSSAWSAHLHGLQRHEHVPRRTRQ